MKRFLLSALIIMFLCSPCFGSKLDDNQLKETYAKSTDVAAQIDAAVANMSTNSTIEVQAGDTLTAGDVCSLISESGVIKAYHNPLTVSTSPNGAESVFNSAATTYISCCQLDSTRFLVAYRDSDTYPKAIVGTVSGSTISWGSESTAFENVAASYMSVCKIATDKVLASYSDGTNNYGQCVVLSISSSTITPGTPISFITAGGVAPTYISSTTLETDKALIAYYSAFHATGLAMVITISGTTPSKGSAFGTEFNAISAGSTAYISVAALSSTSVIVAYQDAANSSYGTAQVLSISGTTITPGTEYVFKSEGINTTAICSLTSTTGIVSCNTTSDNGYAYHFTNSGGEITYGAENAFDADAGVTLYQSLSTIDSSRALFVYRDGTVTQNKSLIFSVSGTTLTASTSYTVNAAQTLYNTICYLGSQKSIIAFRDDGNSSYGTAVVNTAFNTDYSSVRGLSTTAVNSGETATVLLSGTATGLSSILQGQQYWLNTDFSMSTAPVSLAIMKNSSTQTGEIFLGVGKSATEMWFNVDYK